MCDFLLLLMHKCTGPDTPRVYTKHRAYGVLGKFHLGNVYGGFINRPGSKQHKAHGLSGAGTSHWGKILVDQIWKGGMHVG